MHVILLCALAMTIWSGGGLFAKKVGLELGFLRQVGQIFWPLCPWPPNALPIGILTHPIGVEGTRGGRTFADLAHAASTIDATFPNGFNRGEHVMIQKFQLSIISPALMTY